MSARASYQGGFAKFCTWGLIGATAAVALVGVIGMFTPDGEFWGLDRTAWCVVAFAFVMAFAILLVNSMADAAMRAIDGPISSWHWPTLLSSAFCAIVYTIAANLGVHMGWDILVANAAHPENLPSADEVSTIFLFLSAAKPLSRFAIAGCELMERTRLDAADKLDHELEVRARDQEREHRHTERLAEIAARHAPKAASAGDPAGSEPSRQPVRGSRPRLVDSMVKSGAAAAAGLTLLAVGEPAHAVPRTAPLEPVTAATLPRGQPTAAQRAEARALIAQGMAPKQVSDRTGVPHGTCKRQAAEFKRGLWAA